MSTTQRVPSKAIENAYCKYRICIDDKETIFEGELDIRVFKNGFIDIYFNDIDDERRSQFNPLTLTLEELLMMPEAIHLIKKVKNL